VKFYSNQIANIATSISKESISAVLFYGPDHGVVEYSALELTKILKLEKRNISYSDTGPQEINSNLNNMSLFGNKELICIKDIPTALDAKFKEVCKESHHHLLVITTDELAPSSALRKLFELEPNLAAVACYNDNEESVEKIIRSYVVQEKKIISADAMKFLKYNLHGDRFIIINELEKLFCYAVNKQEITLEDVTEVISGPVGGEPDKLCLYFLSGNLKGYFTELEKILSNNTSPIWVIRALIRYYINAYIVLGKMKEGSSIDEAIASLSPPIFFKYVTPFKQSVSKLTIKDVKSALHVLYEAEKSIKSGIFPPKQICDQIFFECNK
jgi:DNA polymerase-3 subunit delta